MDISKIVSVEQLFTLELVHPATEEALGIMFEIRSANSAESKALARQHNDKNLERTQKRKMLKGAVLEKQSVQKAAASIASWNWGEHDWNGEKPVFSMAKAIEMLEAEDWIYDQVVEASETVANFTTKSQKGLPKPSE